MKFLHALRVGLLVAFILSLYGFVAIGLMILSPVWLVFSLYHSRLTGRERLERVQSGYAKLK